MVTIQIGTEQRTLDDPYEPWVTQQITRRRQDGQSPCVRVVVDKDGKGLALKTPGCSSGGGGGSFTPSRRQRQIIDLWHDHALNQSGFAPGQVTAFLKKLEDIV